MPQLENLHDLLVDELKDLYSAENQLLKALPKMAKAASHPKLKAGFTAHLQQTKGHVARLEAVCKKIGVSPKGKTCHAMAGLVEEGAEAIETGAPSAVRDANLIGAAQRVEHYEMAAYGTARAFATVIGESEVADQLKATLDEEGATNQQLTDLSVEINSSAVHPAALEKATAAPRKRKSA